MERGSPNKSINTDSGSGKCFAENKYLISFNLLQTSNDARRLSFSSLGSGSVMAWTHSVMILLQVTLNWDMMTLKRQKVMILKSVIWRLRALAAIVCTCPVLRRDCAASSFWAGKENIILEV